jgi:hypothetical protein
MPLRVQRADSLQAQLQTVKLEDKRKPGVKRERPQSSIAVTARPSKSSRTADGNFIYQLNSEDEAELLGPSTSQTASEKEAKVEVIDLLD